MPGEPPVIDGFWPLNPLKTTKTVAACIGRSCYSEVP